MTAFSGQYNDIEARNLATVRAGFEAWATGTGSPLQALADDATWEITGNSVAARVYTSKEDFMSNVILPFNARMTVPLKPTIREIYADGDTVIVYFDGEATARDGVAYRNTYAWFLTFSGNRIIKGTAFFDSVAFNDLWQRVSPQS
ncbi:ketosteroid isomerase [Mycolicibacterium moriokaense]|uniref:Ketosteroid isomerase n=1 Tax=Mycolicibacterium moriokaense TaxID=39691 RepID=A0AAD1M9C1_9MYCO|nr:nuclear transport factor 2 family protein [Mycolicibacterium moriokaense]MCV7042345.1 nuclear transport factor 2 family protein [Mycolicibacterium moriokaense]ORB23043.1 ketosteroid isomerase [Mycolicibacterium moriokaense]BBX05118.1 ketosteroid isomerase [Mycolicibacterium moriokaense]